MPLVSKFWLSTKKGKEAWVEPIIDKENKTVRFGVKTGTATLETIKKISAGTGFVNGKGKKTKATFLCPTCLQGVAKGDYIDSEASQGNMRCLPMAMVAESLRRRIYQPFDAEQVSVITHNVEREIERGCMQQRFPNEPARGTFASNAQGRIYGFRTFADYFTRRQLVALTVLSELVGEAREKILQDALTVGWLEDELGLNYGGRGAAAYADAVATYLGFLVDKQADLGNSLNRWEPVAQCPRQLFARQAISMVWDFAEGNILGQSSGSWKILLDNLLRSLSAPLFAYNRVKPGFAVQKDSTTPGSYREKSMISTDPPYYDNISYADLADFFYVWLRRSIGHLYPELFSTMLVPKLPELVATPHRFDGDKAKAQHFFEIGLGQAFSAIRRQTSPDYPVTVYYAFKQSETEVAEFEDDEDSDEILPGEALTASTGWETMLTGLLHSGFSITGTWPMRTEMKTRQTAMGTNALASSIVLVCRPRPEDAPTVTRKEFLSMLRRELPQALKELRQGNIAPVDLAQATVGPGMAVFSQYKAVLEANGQAMPVRTALQIINQELDSWLVQQEGAMDQETRFCVAWYEQFGLSEAAFGEADVLARAKNTAVQKLEDQGLLSASKGKVRLLTREELPNQWIPSAQSPVWLCTQHLVRSLATGGEVATAKLAAGFDGTMTDAVKSLAYRLFAIADRKKWSEEALAYNALIASWSDVQAQAIELVGRPRTQGELF